MSNTINLAYRYYIINYMQIYITLWIINHKNNIHNRTVLEKNIKDIKDLLGNIIQIKYYIN